MRALVVLALVSLAQVAHAQRPSCRTIQLETPLEKKYNADWIAALRDEGFVEVTADPDAVATITWYAVQGPSTVDSFGSNVTHVTTNASVRLVSRHGYPVTRKGPFRSALAEALQSLLDATGAIEIEAQPSSAEIVIAGPLPRRGTGTAVLPCLERYQAVPVTVSAAGFETHREDLRPSSNVIHIALKPAANALPTTPILPASSSTGPVEDDTPGNGWVVFVLVGAGVVAIVVGVLWRRRRPSKTRDLEADAPVAVPAAPVVPRGRRVVVAIGIDDYAEWPMLSNAKRDAEKTLEAFARLGFEALAPPLLDGAATAEAMQTLVVDELRKLSPNDSLVVFFAGHGHTVTERLDDGTVVKTGYLMPADAHRPGGSQMKWIRLDTWLSQVSRATVRHLLVIIDACHSGIAIESLIKHRGESTDGLAALRARRSRRVIASALDDQRALDGGPFPGHSLFTGYLIERLAQAPVTGSELGLYVQQRVRAFTKSAQTPDFGSLELDARGELVIESAAGEGGEQV